MLNFMPGSLREDEVPSNVLRSTSIPINLEEMPIF
jgi:hypothetical protein